MLFLSYHLYIFSSFQRNWFTFLGNWGLSPVFRSCFVEVAPYADDFLIYLPSASTEWFRAHGQPQGRPCKLESGSQGYPQAAQTAFPRSPGPGSPSASCPSRGGEALAVGLGYLRVGWRGGEHDDCAPPSGLADETNANRGSRVRNRNRTNLKRGGCE